MSSTTTTAMDTESVALNDRRGRRSTRRLSTYHAKAYGTMRPGTPLCKPLPYSLEALDLSSAQISPALAALRLQVLACLADLETQLSLLDSPISSDALKAKGELKLEEAKAWAREGLEMLRRIRSDVSAHLPGAPSVEEFVKSHMPGLSMNDVRARLSDVPDAVRAKFHELDFSDMRSQLEDVRTRISELHFSTPVISTTLCEHLQSLQTHLASIEIPFASLTSSNGRLSQLLDKVLSSELVSEISADIRNGENKLEKAAMEIAHAMKLSLEGSRLIHYVDLPERWRNNAYVVQGYRFIPLRQWPRLFLSLFAWHNETLNIHTHLIPFVAWSLTIFPFSPFAPSVPTELPVILFTSFALLCLFSSALWHTMAGCADEHPFELCARMDYVGIGWLISASVSTVIWYGMQCMPKTCNTFLGFCIVMGIAGTILPFCDWFNDNKYRTHRISFFVTLAFTAVAPLTYLSFHYSLHQMLDFIHPIMPSLACYTIGLLFYATQFPECYLSTRWQHSRVLDWAGGGSHAIWHIFIVIAIALHMNGMSELRMGIEGPHCH